MKYVFAQWISLFESICLYFRRYGGVVAFIFSPYLHMAIIITIFTYSHIDVTEMRSIVFQFIPNTIGFSLAAFAIYLSIGNEKFAKIMSSSKESENSLLIKGAATFLHFILVQVFTLVSFIIIDQRGYFVQGSASITVNGITYYGSAAFDFVITFLTMYTILNAVAVSILIFNIAVWYSETIRRS